MSDRMTITDIAGFCPEEAIWKMMADVSEILLKDGVKQTLASESIAIAGTSFFVELQKGVDNEFLAPEQKTDQAPSMEQMVWTLGAIAYYMATGHVVFGGHGGKYQKEHPSVPLPVLPKAQQALTPVLHRCLCATPEERVKMDELNAMVQKGLASCSRRMREKQESAQSGLNQQNNNQGDKWPEEMIEI